MEIRPNLDFESTVPLYRQLYEFIRGEIATGALCRGERLPPTREMAGSLGLNRTTVSAAYALLEEAGLIRGEVGRGSFVENAAEQPSRLDWNSILGGSETVSAWSIPEAPISFATARPSEQLFPIDEFRATCREVIQSAEAGPILQLGSPMGYAPLRRYLLETAQKRGLARSDDDILITSGCQQALDLIARVVAGPGSTVLLEDPVYPGLKSVFTHAGSRIAGIPVGPQGADPDTLARMLASERPKVVVITPNFQNPTGATMPAAARAAVLRLAREAGTVLVESDIYGELRYRGEPIPAIKQLDGADDTILLGSFSKMAFPGLRVGWVIGPRAFTARLAEAKKWCDLHTDQLSQAVLLRFAESGRLEAHRSRVVKAGAERLSAALAAARRYLPPEITYTRPQGGMNLWLRLPEPLDAAELALRAHREGVSYMPGKFFAVSRPQSDCLRLSFAGLEPDKIEKGMSILGSVFAADIDRIHSQARLEPAPAIV